MDNTQITQFKKSLDNMRAKVIAAKGKSVDGLTPLTNLKTKKNVASSKTREEK